MKKTTKVATVGVVSARRRLIRGAFAAPTALTLYSGNVFASSSSLRAVTRRIEVGGEFPDSVELLEATDTWVKVEVFEVNGVKVVKSAGIADCGANSTMSFQNSFQNGLARVDGSLEALPMDVEPTTTNKYAALLFNELGEIAGVYAAEDGLENLTALTRSAGASIGLACAEFG
jgi:hypothetical protein